MRRERSGADRSLEHNGRYSRQRDTRRHPASEVEDHAYSRIPGEAAAVAMPIDPLDYYNPEINLFPQIARRFAETGEIDPMALYLILDWKAPRARTRHLKRLVKEAGSLDAAVRRVAAALAAAAGPEQRLCILMTKP